MTPPLTVTETVIDPPNKIVAKPGIIQYYVTVQNNSTEYTATDLVLSNIYPGFEYPVCGVTPGYVPAPDLTVTPDVCLPQSPFTLGPLESISVIVRLPIEETNPDPEIVTTSRVSGNIIIEGVARVIDPPIQSDENVVLVERANLVLKHQLFADSACTEALVNVQIPDRDKNDDGIPENGTRRCLLLWH